MPTNTGRMDESPWGESLYRAGCAGLEAQLCSTAEGRAKDSQELMARPFCIIGSMTTRHKVLDYDESAGTLECAKCGTVQLKYRRGIPKCSVAVKEQNSHRHPPGTRKYNPDQAARTYRTMPPEKRMFYDARRRASRDGRPFDLAVGDIVVPDRCPILGIELITRRGGTGPSDNSPTLDRRDNSRGYVRDNIQVISHRANRIKSDATKEELLAIAASM